MQKKTSYVFVIFGVSCVLVVLIIIIFMNHLSRNQAIPNNFVFTDPKMPGKAQFPFTLNNGMIHFYGILEGRQVPIVLDTGAANSSVPSRWKLVSKHSAKAFTFSDAYNTQIEAIPVSFPVLHLPGCDINTYTAMELSAPNLGNASKFVPVNDEMLLGNSALWNSIITIDYKKKMLTFSSANTTSPGDKIDSENRTAVFGWVESDSRNNLGGPILYGSVKGKPITILLDTGAVGSIFTSPQLFAALRRSSRYCTSQFHVNSTGEGGSKIAEALPMISLKIDKHSPNAALLKVQAQAVRLDRIAGTASAIMGTDMLRDYVITLDYPRRTITLSPSK